MLLISIDRSNIIYEIGRFIFNFVGYIGKDYIIVAML